ncbi:MAG: antitoxin Xre/MbcA/ParS toxin-binding domain-containing protein [Gemmobacter sp.]
MPDRRPLRQRLAEYWTPEELDLWLDSPQRQLDGAVPRQLIAAGRAEEVHRLIDRMDEGVYL